MVAGRDYVVPADVSADGAALNDARGEYVCRPCKSPPGRKNTGFPGRIRTAISLALSSAKRNTSFNELNRRVCESWPASAKRPAVGCESRA